MNRHTIATITVTSAVTAALVLAVPAGAREVAARLTAGVASTTTVPVQLRLTGSGGTPLNGLKTLTFKLYNAPSGGSALWTESWTAGNAVPVTDGVAGALLGSVTPLPQSLIAGNNTLFLGVTVDVEAEMQPRIQLGSAPYAFTVADRSITTSKLASGTVVTRHLLPWFDSETPCATTSTSYVGCGNTWGFGLPNGFPPVTANTSRRYAVMIACSSTGGDPTYFRIIKRLSGEVVQETQLPGRWAGSAYQTWTYGAYLYDVPGEHMDFQVRTSGPGITLWLYRVWVVAEDYIP